MAEYILTPPASLFDIATRIEEETGNFKVCRSLMNAALQFSYLKAEEVGLAQSQLFFLVAALGDIEKRLGAIESAAYDLTPPASLFDLATRIEEETSNVKVCRSLMIESLQFSYVEAEAVGLAQSQLFFLVAALGDIEKRLGAIESAAYDIARTEKAAA